MSTATETRTMKCADEKDWPERVFNVESRDDDDNPCDWSCDYCGWMQTSFVNGCRELVLSAIWHDADLLSSYLREALKGGPLEGEVRIDML
jgi:hypothetical protein